MICDKGVVTKMIGKSVMSEVEMSVCG